jgi:hypothetical protein
MILQVQKLKHYEHPSNNTNQGEVLHAGNSIVHSEFYKCERVIHWGEKQPPQQWKESTVLWPVLIKCDELPVVTSTECLSCKVHSKTCVQVRKAVPWLRCLVTAETRV